MPQENPTNEVVLALEAMIQNGSADREKLTELGLISESQLNRLNEIKDSVEQSNELMNIVIQIVDKMSKKEEPEVKKVQILGAEIVTIKGEKGDKPTEEELKELIKPLIPEVKDGHTPTEEELTKIIKPLIPEPIKGDQGDDYIITENDKKEIAGMIEVPIVEKVIEKTEVIKEVTKEVPNEITADEILAKIKTLKKGGRINYEDIDDTPDIPSLISRIRSERSTWGNGFLRELSDVSLGNTEPTNGYVLTWNSTIKKWEAKAQSGGGGGGTWGSITGTLSDQTDLQSALDAKQGLITATNGITKTASTIKIGGSITEDTSLIGGIYDFLLQVKNLSLLGVSSATLSAPTVSISGATEIRLRTPDVNSGSSAAGRFLKLVNDASGQVEFDSVPGGGTWGSITGTLSSQTDLQNALNTKEDVVNKSTSVATDQASNTKYPSVKAVFDWATGVFTTTSAVASQITTALSGYATQAWVTSQGYITNVVTALGFTPENVANKSTTTTLGTSDTLYPTQNAVKTYVDNAWIVQPINAQTGTTYTFVLSDAGKLVTGSNASAITFTVPPNSSVAFAVGTHIDVTQTGAGVLSIAPGSGVTINSQDSNRKIFAQYVSATLIKTATDTWLLVGNLRA